MKKTIFIGLILSMAIGFAFTNLNILQSTGEVNGTVHDVFTHQTLEHIWVEEIVNKVAIQSVKTDSEGRFSISVRHNPANLRFSDPDQNRYKTQSDNFDWKNTACSNETIYLEPK